MTSKVSWEQFHQACLVLARSLAHEHISGIAPVIRGGLIPAAILSHELQRPITFTINPFLPKLGASMRSDLLIIDEICDTGKTFDRLQRHFRNARYAAVYVKPQGKQFCHHHAIEVAQDNWLDFAWERPDDALSVRSRPVRRLAAQRA